MELTLIKYDQQVGADGGNEVKAALKLTALDASVVRLLTPCSWCDMFDPGRGSD